MGIPDGSRGGVWKSDDIIEEECVTSMDIKFSSFPVICVHSHSNTTTIIHLVPSQIKRLTQSCRFLATSQWEQDNNNENNESSI